MPELPEVEATCRRLALTIPGKRIRVVHVIRPATIKPQDPATLAELVTGRAIKGVRRRGKNILIDLAGSLVLRTQLRMTGELYAENPPNILPAVRVWFELSGGNALVFLDPRGIGRMNIGSTAEMEEPLEGLGVEPLSPQFKLHDFVARAARSRRPAKVFLLDQKQVAGLGNVYAAEALFRAGIDPRTRMAEIGPERLRRLYYAIRTVLREAVRSATIAYKHPGKFREGEFARGVYARAGQRCPVCRSEILRIRQAGRSTYYCPYCQR